MRLRPHVVVASLVEVVVLEELHQVLAHDAVVEVDLAEEGPHAEVAQVVG